MYRCSIFEYLLKWKQFRSHIPLKTSTSIETTSWAQAPVATEMSRARMASPGRN